MNVKEIAEQSGVSVATVSRVLNGKDNVNELTREKVMKVIKTSGYEKKMLNKHRAFFKIELVVVLMRDIYKPFLQELLCAFEQYSIEYPFKLMFYSVPGRIGFDKDMEEIIRIAKGVIVFSSCVNDWQAIERLKREKIPVVVIDNSFADIKVNTLLVDNKSASARVVNYLVEQKHARIACLAGLPNIMVLSERLRGYSEAMRCRNLYIHKDYIQYCEEEAESVAEAVDYLLRMEIQIRPTAIYCYTDVVAYMAVGYLQTKGLKVPGDISVIGFDSQLTVPRDYRGPQLTTIRQPFSMLARESLEIIKHELRMGVSNKPILKIYDTELVIGESTGIAPNYNKRKTVL